jgi:hypothetical protein
MFIHHSFFTSYSNKFNLIQTFQFILLSFLKNVTYGIAHLLSRRALAQQKWKQNRSKPLSETLYCIYAEYNFFDGESFRKALQASYLIRKFILCTLLCKCMDYK